MPKWTLDDLENNLEQSKKMCEDIRENSIKERIEDILLDVQLKDRKKEEE